MKHRSAAFEVQRTIRRSEQDRRCGAGSRRAGAGGFAARVTGKIVHRIEALEDGTLKKGLSSDQKIIHRLATDALTMLRFSLRKLHAIPRGSVTLPKRLFLPSLNFFYKNFSRDSQAPSPSDRSPWPPRGGWPSTECTHPSTSVAGAGEVGSVRCADTQRTVTSIPGGIWAVGCL